MERKVDEYKDVKMYTKITEDTYVHIRCRRKEYVLYLYDNHLVKPYSWNGYKVYLYLWLCSIPVSMAM